MKYGELTYREIRAAANRNAISIVPTGCTEQQGPHLPVDFDTWFAEAVCVAASERAWMTEGIESLVLPVLPFGPTPEHRNFGSGYINLDQQLHEAVLMKILESLTEQGFLRTMIWRGCGQHDLGKVVEKYNSSQCGRAQAYQPESPFQETWNRIGDSKIPGGHADSFTTSITLHLRPTSVRRDLIPEPEIQNFDWDDPNLDFAAYSSTGVIGDASAASAELGAELWSAVVNDVANIIIETASS